MARITIGTGLWQTIKDAINDNFTELYAAIVGNVPARTGGTVAFDTPSVYNSPSTPANFSGFSFTGATINTEVIGYFNNAVEPTWGAGTYITGVWNPNQLNTVRFIYVAENNVSIQIFSAQGQSTNIDTRLTYVRLGSNATTSATTESNVISAAVAANSSYLVEAFMMFGCGAGTGGTKFGYQIPTGSTFGNTRFGNTTTSTAFLGTAIESTSNLFSGQAWGAFADASGIIRKLYQNYGTLDTGITTGSFNITFGAVTGGEVSTVYRNGSFLKLTKIS